jgi:hypothetical protein
MLLKLKPFFSVFLLVIFLFPTIVKEAHTGNHGKRAHCDANEEQHIHIQHHDCTFCDFVIPIILITSSCRTVFSLLHFAEYFFSPPIEFYFSTSLFSSALLRAPPYVF